MMTMPPRNKDIINPAYINGAADPSGETMMALVWMTKNQVEVIDEPEPKLMEPQDNISNFTGSAVCGSDSHLLHGVHVELQKRDILGHELCGMVHNGGPEVTNLKKW
ncbi:hypothetical protein GQ43DRAFT_468697 [Delitschia confertaspora ATCC 74209]|uniref:Alcohol dehydrogenase-like N-terminal domain-containing protein n=1 Tax=Delitschia confertaspora ATCC 74209 TaxID=1513339 RepID=A0A9P4MZ49_9PLEO|nr:hypothetical protein GQ43DRAFT_468697 [Delitschia confertaspora ATCC 74209]